MLKHITAAVVMGLTLAGPAVAQTRQKPEVREPRQKNLMVKRIHQGIRSGQLTRDEVRQIRQKLRSLRADARQRRADGALSRQDRQELRRERRQISRFVFLKKHR